MSNRKRSAGKPPAFPHSTSPASAHNGPDPSPVNTFKIITLGSIGRPYGIKGWMRLQSFTDPPENIFTYANLLIQQKHQWQPLHLSAFDELGTDILIKIEDCDTPEDARHYTRALVGVTRDQLPDLPEGEYYWCDLEGLTVINKENQILGEIDHLFASGANDIIAIKNNGKEYLLPYIKEVVLKVDLADQKMYVDWDLEWDL